MTNERTEKGASASWQPMRSLENVQAGLDVDKIFELGLSMASSLGEWYIL